MSTVVNSPGDVIVSSVQGQYTEFVFSVPTAKTKTSAIVTGREKEYAGGINSSGLIPVQQEAAADNTDTQEPDDLQP